MRVILLANILGYKAGDTVILRAHSSNGKAYIPYKQSPNDGFWANENYCKLAVTRNLPDWF